MKTLQFFIGIAGIFIAAQTAQAEQPAATPVPSRTPMRLLFNAYDNDARKVKVEKIYFQINTLDLRQPTEFLKLGDMIPNTTFKLTKFEYKTRPNPTRGTDDDVSELTITNTKSGATAVLVYQKTTDMSTAGAAK
jgi:hypothetical protein